ncbi:phage tail assembly chaperone [Longirhabdus pacifica]|uniref:phage tail assembly chaperone n=1 Tax=Longirhabdus pacifica TaxID=2305227 RepID=UPI001008FEF9|nr:phage portal protein [Longirhabdus pacifica]
MSNLSAFLAQNAVQNEGITFVASKRFVDDHNEPMEWEIRCITSEEDEVLRKSCTHKVPVPGKRGQYTQETDYHKYLGKLAVKCTVFPNLNDTEVQNSYGVMGADVLLKTMLRPGEYAEYLNKIQEVNGFEVSMEDMVDEAKN